MSPFWPATADWETILGWVATSEREIQRIEGLSEVMSGRRTLVAAAAALAVTPRHARRLPRRPQAGGGAALEPRAGATVGPERARVAAE